MTDEQRKALTEYLGECWLWDEDLDDEGMCKKCGQCFESHRLNRTFDNDTDMMALYRAIYKKGKWSKFIIYTEKTYCFQLQLDSLRHNLHNFNAWLFCLDGKDYEARCCLVAEWLEVKK